MVNALFLFLISLFYKLTLLSMKDHDPATKSKALSGLL